MSNYNVAGLSTAPASSPLELLEVALYLHDISIKSNKLTNPEKVFPQFNSEKSLFAYACQKLFNGKTGLDATELEQAREFVKPLQQGFRSFLGYLLQQDTMLRLQTESANFNSPLFFVRTNQTISSGVGNFAIAIKRMEVTNIKKGVKELITSIVFIPEVKATIAVQPVEPVKNVQPQPEEFLDFSKKLNGVHAPASM